MEVLIYIAVACALLALGFALILFYKVGKVNAGNDRMKKIAEYIRAGANAFLKREYKILILMIILVAVFLVLALNWMTAVCFVTGALLSMTAGFCGMTVATKANVRTANEAQKGMKEALKVAFSGGAVMGMCVVGFGLIGATLLFIVFKDPAIITGFGLGASFVALFARVGGGIYTKAADVGADLVGKVESGIPEDDPRNPAVIADNVGDNVGDVAGMGADLFESYVGSIIAAITLSILAYGALKGPLFVFLIMAAGVVSSIIGSLFVGMKCIKNPRISLQMSTYISGAIFIPLTFVISFFILGTVLPAVCVVVGLAAGVLIGFITELYTSGDYKAVKSIVEQSKTGAATNIIGGLATGMKSTVLPIIMICIAIFVSYAIGGSFGIAVAAIGMLSITGVTVAVDAYGPIADNAGGIAEMSGLPENVRGITDQLDSVGNTTAAIGKGFAIGSAALTALVLFLSYMEAAKISVINLADSRVIIGMFIGGALTFLFSALTMDSVGKAASAMIDEVRRQFRDIEGVFEGTTEPDYVKCVDISTTAALKHMIVPGVIAVLTPVAVGFVLGTSALGGLLAGALVTGVLMAIMMSNAGGAWDNAKKYIESVGGGGKGSDAHKAAVIGDTVGDPLKDTSGPSLNILIKLLTIVSLLIAPILPAIPLI